MKIHFMWWADELSDAGVTVGRLTLGLKNQGCGHFHGITTHDVLYFDGKSRG